MAFPPVTPLEFENFSHNLSHLLQESSQPKPSLKQLSLTAHPQRIERKAPKSKSWLSRSFKEEKHEQMAKERVIWSTLEGISQLAHKLNQDPKLPKGLLTPLQAERLTAIPELSTLSPSHLKKIAILDLQLGNCPKHAQKTKKHLEVIHGLSRQLPIQQKRLSQLAQRLHFSSGTELLDLLKDPQSNWKRLAHCAHKLYLQQVSSPSQLSRLIRPLDRYQLHQTPLLKFMGYGISLLQANAALSLFHSEKKGIQQFQGCNTSAVLKMVSAAFRLLHALPPLEKVPPPFLQSLSEFSLMNLSHLSSIAKQVLKRYESIIEYPGVYPHLAEDAMRTLVRKNLIADLPAEDPFQAAAYYLSCSKSSSIPREEDFFMPPEHKSCHIDFSIWAHHYTAHHWGESYCSEKHDDALMGDFLLMLANSTISLSPQNLRQLLGNKALLLKPPLGWVEVDLQSDPTHSTSIPWQTQPLPFPQLPSERKAEATVFQYLSTLFGSVRDELHLYAFPSTEGSRFEINSC